MKRISLLFLLGLLVGVYGCRDKQDPECTDETNPECPNYNPCATAKALTAAFTVYETHWAKPKDWVDIDSDTLLNYGVNFTALDDNCSYEWVIGRETLTTRTVYREFFPRGVNIPITLTVRRSNSTCLPGDTVKIKTRKLYFLDPDNLPTYIAPYVSYVFGKYKGYNTNKPDSLFEIRIDTINLPRGKPDANRKIVWGLTGNCEAQFDGSFITYTKINFAPAGNVNCSSPWGTAQVYGNQYQNLKFDYTMYTIVGNSNSPRIAKTFIGTRIK